MDYTVLILFGIVYIGMILGGIPGLALDRTGVALVGAIGLLLTGRVTIPQFKEAIDFSTIALLFGLMIVSAQFRMAGFYSHIVKQVADIDVSPRKLLAIIIVVTGALSALLVNDIVCLAVTPVLIEGCARKKLNPVPFLLALACASNIGSAATLIGNPQNMLIGQMLHLSFASYLFIALIPTLIGFGIIWSVICLQTRGNWELHLPVPQVKPPQFNQWQATKGSFLLIVMILLFLVSPFPRDIIALFGAALLLCSRHMRSHEILGLVDWQLLALFISLFVVNHAFDTSGGLELLTHYIKMAGIHLEKPAWLFGMSVVLSNIVSNVPAVMLLLPSASHPLAGSILAISSTLAGNLFIVGSIANIIVIDNAERLGIRISWSRHAKTGVPVTLLSLGFAGFWLWLLAR